MKKFIYSLFIFFVVLVVAIVVAANSSYVIKKVADIFAPEYKISYDDITGNVFTGVNIAGLKFDNKEITKNIKFSWNPSKILYKRVAINEISGDDLDVDTVKELIASFPKSVDDNSSSSPLPVVITVDKIHLSINPFVEQGISIEKTLLDIKDVTYASDEVSVENLFLKVDTNVTDLVLSASLNDGKLLIDELSVKNIDSVTLENMFMPKESNVSKESSEDVQESVDKNKKSNSEEINPLIPKEVVLKHFLATLMPRAYKEANLDKLELSIKNANVDVQKVLSNKKSAILVDRYALNFQSDVGQIKINGGLKDDIVLLNDVNLTKIDTMALKAMFAPDNNESNETNETSQDDEVISVDKNETSAKEQNNLIPKKVVLKVLHTDILAATFEPVKIENLALNIKDVSFDILKLMVEKGNIELDGETNLSNFKHKSTITNNTLLGNLIVIPNDELFTTYSLPIRREALGDIKIDFNASKDEVVANLNLKAKQLLIVATDLNTTDINVTDSNVSDANISELNKTKPVNFDIDDLNSKVVFKVKSKKVEANTKIVLTTPYAKNISITNKFMMDNNISYDGAINISKVISPDGKRITPLNDFKIAYSGTLNSVDTQISSEGLKGSFVSKDMKKGHFHLESKKVVAVGKILELPAELNATKVNLYVDIPIDFTNISNLKGKAKISSNVANVDADILYGKRVKIRVKTTIPKDSLLMNFDKNVKYSAISPMLTNFEMGDNDIKVTMKSSKLSANLSMLPFEKKVNGKIKIAGLLATLLAKPNGDIVIKTDVGSFNSLLSSVNQFYNIEGLPKVDGALNISMLVDNNKHATLNISSPKVIYHADRKTDHEIENVKVVLDKQGSQIRLKEYNLVYNKMKIFSTKPSIVNMDKENIIISQLWLNDQLKVSGNLDTKKMKGKIVADAATFHLAHEMIDLDSAIKIDTLLEGNSTSINGKVTLLGGDIHYDLATKTFPSDSDILIVQEMKKKEPSPFMDNLTMLINIDTKKPLIFKQGPINVQAKVNMGVHKSINSDPMILGSVDLVDGGSYIFQGKKFVLDKSHVYFTGDPSKPMLDITVKHRTIKNSRITINITGTPSAPNILFSSVPSMTKEQILSIILFDSEEGAGTNSGDDMMKMMGGAMAKSALSNLGVQLDHLVFGEGNSVEVGKKISDDVTVIYINGDIPEMQVKYDYSPSIEAVIGASERSESADVVYKKDFSADDIIIMGR
jgi:translocation and assembly module TamB